jgi:carboxymethylenebutenolidase
MRGRASPTKVCPTIDQYFNGLSSDVMSPIAHNLQEQPVHPTIDVNTPDGTFKAYIARPAILPAPAIVVIQEIFGVNEDLRDTCDELAKQGYVALSPDLFWRMEPGVDLSDQTEAEWKKGFALYTAFNYPAGVSDIAATLQVARALPGASGKVGLMGYCLGGLMTFLTTARRGADASVVFYGGNTEKHLNEARNIKNPLMMHLGEEDEYISKEAQSEIIAALTGNEFAEVFTYPGCRHAFARHRGIHFDKDAARLANRRTAEFFQLHLA